MLLCTFINVAEMMKLNINFKTRTWYLKVETESSNCSVQGLCFETLQMLPVQQIKASLLRRHWLERDAPGCVPSSSSPRSKRFCSSTRILFHYDSPEKASLWSGHWIPRVSVLHTLFLLCTTCPASFSVLAWVTNSSVNSNCSSAWWKTNILAIAECVLLENWHFL